MKTFLLFCLAFLGLPATILGYTFEFYLTFFRGGREILQDHFEQVVRWLKKS